MYYVYILRSTLKNNEIYIGYTKSVIKRLKEHNQGNTFSTKRYCPWKLLYYEAYLTEDLAKLREKRLKHHGNAIRELREKNRFLRLFFKKDISGAGYGARYYEY